MKKPLSLLLAILVIAGFVYFHFSAPKVIERRLGSLLATMSFAPLSLGDINKDADKFAAHFADQIEFSGSGNSIIAGTVSPSEIRDLYLTNFRASAKSSQAKTTGDLRVKLQTAEDAQMEATIQLDIIFRDNTSYPQTLPARLTWKKESGQWLITKVQLQDPINGLVFP